MSKWVDKDSYYPFDVPAFVFEEASTLISPYLNTHDNIAFSQTNRQTSLVQQKPVYSWVYYEDYLQWPQSRKQLWTPTRMHFKDGFNEPLQPGDIPLSVRRVAFDPFCYNQPLLPGVIHDQVTHLHGTSDRPGFDSIPASVVDLRTGVQWGTLHNEDDWDDCYFPDRDVPHPIMGFNVFNKLK